MWLVDIGYTFVMIFFCKESMYIYNVEQEVITLFLL